MPRAKNTAHVPVRTAISTQSKARRRTAAPAYTREIPNRSASLFATALRPAPAEDRPLLLDAGLERGARVHALDERGELRKAPALGGEARVAQVHEDRGHREVGDREALADEEL